MSKTTFVVVYHSIELGKRLYLAECVREIYSPGKKPGVGEPQEVWKTQA